MFLLLLLVGAGGFLNVPVASAVHSYDDRVLRAEREVCAVAAAYPDRIDAIEFRDGDWALQMDGIWYYWARGRFLPSEHRENWEDFVVIRFYNYRTGPYAAPEISPELDARLRDRTDNRDNDTRLFGLRARVHPFLVDPLSRVEARVTVLRDSDADLDRYLDDLFQIHGYNWRNIAGTARRSYHAYGVAVDLVPIRYDDFAYWRWAADSGVTEWWRLTLDERHFVPQTLIDAFEAEGFVWGGKWLFFDTIHFEYRPEVLTLAGEG